MLRLAALRMIGDDRSVPLPSVRLREIAYDAFLEVEGHGFIALGEDDSLIGPIEVARFAGLSSLRQALLRYWGATAPPPRTFVHPETGDTILIPSDPGPYRARVQFVDVPTAKFAERHTYEFLAEPVAIVIREGGALAVQVQLAIEGEAEPDPDDLERLLTPLMRRTGARMDGIDIEPEGRLEFRTSTVVASPDFWVITVYLVVPTHGRDVAFALNIGNEALAVLEAANGARMTPAAAISLVEGGHAHALKGQPEGGWLDCKSKPYERSDEGSFELAKDVSAFANSVEGGLIIIGLRTRSIDGRDVITSVTPFPADGRISDRYRKLLGHRVFPRPVGLRIETVRYGTAGALMTIAIPAQPPALQPFLVRGALNGKKVSGNQISIFLRSGDATVVTGAEEFHSLLVAGRVALGYDHAHLPPDDGARAR